MGTLGWGIVDVLWGFLLGFLLMMSLDYMRILDGIGWNSCRNLIGCLWKSSGAFDEILIEFRMLNDDTTRVLQMMFRECLWIWIVNI